MHKRYSIILVILLFTGLISGCSSIDTAETGKVRVVATIYPQYDFTRQIGDNNVDLKLLLSPGMESHSYEPTPQDIRDIASCDIFIYVGGEGDKWVDNILASIDTEDIKIIALTDCVELLDEELVEGMQDTHDHDHETMASHGHDEHDHEDESAPGHEKDYDEHVWTSPKNVKLIAEEITKVLIGVDPSNKSAYEQNSSGYIAELDALDRELESIVENASRRTIIVGDRFPFRYFTEAYGLKYYAAFPGCAADAEPSAATIKFLIDKIKEEDIPVVFHMELSNERITDTLCEGTGAKKLSLHSCHNVTKTDFETGTTYLDLMYQNAEALREALY